MDDPRATTRINFVGFGAHLLKSQRLQFVVLRQLFNKSCTRRRRQQLHHKLAELLHLHSGHVHAAQEAI